MTKAPDPVGRRTRRAEFFAPPGQGLLVIASPFRRFAVSPIRRFAAAPLTPLPPRVTFRPDHLKSGWVSAAQ